MSLGNILISLVSEHKKQWDQVLPQVEFAYNDSPNKSTGMISFQILYGMHPRGICELRNMGKEKLNVDVEDFSTAMQSLWLKGSYMKVVTGTNKKQI